MKKTIFLIVILVVSKSFGATFNIPNGDVSALIAAIVSANTNTEADVINLAANGSYVLTAVNYTSANPGNTGLEGQRGLPSIVNNVAGLDLTINGNGSTIQRNATSANFGLLSCGGYTIFNNVTFRNGNVNAQGGAIFVQFKGNVEANNCKFYDNTSLLDAEGGGGAIYTKSLSILKVTNCYFENNKAVNQGGAISNLLSDLTVINCTFKANVTTNLGSGTCGGAVYIDGARGDNGKLIFRGSTFDGNICPKGQGGGMFSFPYRNQSMEVTNCIFKNNKGFKSGGLWHKGGGSSAGIPDSEYPLTIGVENTSLLLTDCVFDKNTADEEGGGMTLLEVKNVSEITRCSFSNNQSPLGGAIFLVADEPINVSNSTFNNNKANQAGAFFVGVRNTLNITNCTFAYNIANQYGGAMAVPQNAAAVNITNCIFANNQANNPNNGQSGAIHSGNNTANNTVTIKNNIFVNNTVTNTYGASGTSLWRDCNSILKDGGNNIFFPTGTAQSCVTTPNFVDPLLGPLADNGGPTQTMALLEGSPAINKGTGCPTFDQRGATRVGACDIGAFEFGGTNIPASIASETTVANKLVIYPNPSANSDFKIVLPASVIGKNIVVQVLNINGEIVKTIEQIADKEVSIYIDVQGAYFVRIISSNVTLIGTIIKL